MKDELITIEARIREIDFQLKTLYAIKVLTDDNIKQLESKICDLEFNKMKLL
jgi:hypothetical protein